MKFRPDTGINSIQQKVDHKDHSVAYQLYRILLYTILRYKTIWKTIM